MSRPPATVRQEWSAGWPVVIASLFGFALPTIYVYSVGSLIAPLEVEFGWTRAQISSGLSVVTLMGAILSPFVGVLIDRIGPRRIALPGALLLCGSFGIISLANGSLWQWWLLWFLLVFVAAGLKPVVWSLSVASTFEKGRGFALAVALSGSGLGLAVMPLLSIWIIDNYGWRAAPPLLGLIVGVVVVPILYFGLHSGADAASKARRSGSDKVQPAKAGVDARTALLSGRFFRLAVASFLATVTGVGLGTNYVPVLTDLGLDRSEAAATAGLAGIASIIGRLATGVLLDRYRANLVGDICVLLPLISCFLLLSSTVTIPIAMIAVFLFGCALGAEIDIIAYLTAEQFGTARYGTIFGVIAGLWSLATAIGPLAISYVYDVTGSYDLVIWLIIPAIVVTSLCLFSLRRPQDVVVHVSTAEAIA